MSNFSGSFEDLVAQKWNASTIDFGEITMNRNFVLLIVSLISAILWVVYITYYNSRVLGYILTRLINKFYFQNDNFKIGSFTLNTLSGKIMFRDIVYMNYDYTLRIQDGYLIFRWWRSYIPKDVSEDLSHSDTRLSIMLNGFELHVYNRCDLYNELEKIFGLEPLIKMSNDDDDESGDRDKAMNDANEKRRRAQGAVRSEAAMARTWRDLIPVIKIDICSGRVVFGNRLVPSTLSISIEETHLVYSTKPPASSLDHLMHFVKAKAENCKIILAPSPNYTAMVDEPPRFMGEGFVVMSSNYIEVYFYMDDPGLVPEQPVLLQLANGDIVESAPPIWGVDIKCGKGTDFSYGPWADRQRDHLFKFFFPPNYKNMEVTPQPKPGDRRQTQSFDIRLSTLNEATIDILFTKNKETNAVHINIGAGSYLEVTLPWIVLQDGYTTKITGQLLHLDATTSLQYRSLAESETLEYTVKCHYPLVWNHHQCWQLALTGCKATAHIVYTHIDFFQDLVNDWATKTRPDILSFVPYTWKISLLLKECEVITLSNQHNWIDCSSTNQENSHVAFCGDLLDVSFDLPFIDFLPDIIPLKIWIQGEAVDMSLYLPEVNTSRLLLLSIDKNMKLVPCRLKASKWRRRCVKNQGWVDCWSVPIVALSVRYSYHPIPPLGPEPQADITTPEKEEILLSPMRIPRMRKKPQMNWAGIDGNNFDRTSLAPDKVSVELEVGPSVLFAYGTIITGFMNLLENIFGEDQTFTDMQKTPTMDVFNFTSEHSTKYNDRASVGHNDISVDESHDSRKNTFDPRKYRSMDVTVSIILHDIQAHLVKHCSESEPTCPIIVIERFGFEMDKSFRETKLQLLLSPSILVSPNNLSRSNPNNSGALYQGHLMLSSFQLRGHGLFSDTHRTADEDTVEYAWMMELQLGQLTGRMTLPQLYHVISSLETFLLLILDSENELEPPNPNKFCHHGVNTLVCPETDVALKYRCPTANEIKYKMVRVGIDLIDIYLADTNTTLQTKISPVRLSFCNLHGPGFASGVTALLPNIKLALYTQTNMQSSTHYQSTGSSASQVKPPENENWLQVGSVTLGPVLIEAAGFLPQSPKNLHSVQQKFLKLHDDKTKRLWFLWSSESKSMQCGCSGGCTFFGSNRNGATFFKPNVTEAQDGVNVAMFNVLETLGEYGYGQSLLHPGQLVFHTPPYNTMKVCLQPTVSLVPSPLPQTLNKSPQTLDRRSLTRRFSYTNVNKGSNNMVSSTKSDVPYARLVDTSIPLANSKIDSDSKLNKSVLSVPQMESSVSDSRLALNSAAKDKTVPKDSMKTFERDAFVVPRITTRSVAVSDSHYSLNVQSHQDDLAEVHRTTSITSENPSEAFFSADEDIFPSRSSSLKHAIGSRQGATRERSSLGVNEVPKEQWTNSIPRSEANHIPDNDSNQSSEVRPDSESGSVSSTSFISAISSQEDMTLVNLHMQSNKPIVESPLLMASYIQNLAQYRCLNWGTCSLPTGSDVYTAPLFKRADDGTLIYVGQKYLPCFEPIGKVEVLKLLSKKEGHGSHSYNGSYPNQPPNFNAQLKAHPFPQAWWEIQQNTQESQENVTEKSTTSNITTTSDTNTGLYVKFRGEIDVMLSPLVLESAQKFLESLTPVLANIHPITVINHLRLVCISSVEKANILKQKKHVHNWLPQMQARNQSSYMPGKDDKCKISTIPQTNVYEEMICEQFQATVSVPKVNVIFIQSSVVEDMISFSALDNIQDLTCVSLFGMSVENVVARFHNFKKTLEAVQLYYRPTLRTLGSKKSFGIMKGPRALISTQASSGRKGGPEKGEPVYIEAPQQQWEETTFNLNIGKVHGQLRRLRSESTQIKDAIITAIPCHYSKVAFKFAKVDGLTGNEVQVPCGSSAEHKECALGYIMFECGLEGVSIKASKNSQSQKPNEEKCSSKTDNESCRESVKSTEEKPEKAKNRSSGIEDLFRKRDSSSKPSTPNLGSTQPPPQVPPAEPLTPGPEELSNNDSTNTVVPIKDSGNCSSCSIDLKIVWFNFAAPPRTPITRKIDYTRLDWNLLSTASPAINAWMNPCNRVAIRAVAMWRARARRLAAAAAALMAAALDLPAVNTLPKSRYGRHTALSRALREEPSLQLCGVLLRHSLAADAAALQADLAPRHLPSLSTLRQGVIVLTRQWKNILYTPLLLEHNYKSKMLKPLNVTFALPDLIDDSVEGWQEYQIDAEGLDENCLLLDMDEKINIPAMGAYRAPSRPHSFPSSTPPQSVRSQGRPSLVFPSLSFGKKNSTQEDAVAMLPDYGGLQEDLPNVGSNPSLYSPHGSDENIKNDRAREDLYQWMAKQEPIKVEPRRKKPAPPVPPAPRRAPPLSGAGAPVPAALYPLQGSLMLLDAHLVFQPLLAALGVAPHQVAQGETAGVGRAGGGGAGGGGGGGGGGGSAGALEALGSALSLTAWAELLRGDIAPSDTHHHTHHAPPPTDVPAFLCEKMSLEVEVRKVADMAMDELVQRQNVLYISRSQLKRHISSVLNFHVGVRVISQQVNMPLLRLLHQISSMYQNVKDTQSELHNHDARQKHASSSVSDFQENLVSVSSLDKDPAYLEPNKWELLTPLPSADLPPATPVIPPTPPPVPVEVRGKSTAGRRPQSFAQKLRSTGKTVKGKLGYSSLSEGAHTPLYSVLAAPAAAGAGVGAGGPAGVRAEALAPRCWATVYQLLQLYAAVPNNNITHRSSMSRELPPPKNGRRDRPPALVVRGNVKIVRVRVLASLSGLKLEVSGSGVAASLAAGRARHAAARVARVQATLQEGHAQTIVRITVGKSLAAAWQEAGGGGGGGEATCGARVSLGAARCDLPQHPVALHGVMTRSSRHLSTTLQELGVTRAPSRVSRGGGGGSAEEEASPPPAPRAPAPPSHTQHHLQPPAITFNIMLQSLSITAALLPSLQAQYKMERVVSCGVTGSKAHFTVQLPTHCLSFVTKLQIPEANIPAAALVSLPGVAAAARVEDGGCGGDAGGLVLKGGRYLSASAEIGLFEHTLSTDLLNHLVFVQKVFMKEVNEVVQKVSGGERPVPLWADAGAGAAHSPRLLFSLTIRIKRIQLTATTPSNSAVRLETGAVEFTLSNRVQNVPHTHGSRLFAKLQVDLNLSLGQLIRNAMFEEAEPEFQQYAFFNTRITMRNAFQDEMISGEDKEVVLITLKRPLIYIQPVAVDKAILVWLNYKTAYNYWNEKRLGLNKEVRAATQQLFEKVQLTSQMTAQHVSTLFLQLNVDDIGICLPLNQPPTPSWVRGVAGGGGCGGGGGGGEAECRGAVVITLESTSISACSVGALASKGRFVGLCLRFADDFEASLDDWKPDPNETFNICSVSEGTYEVCSRTTAAKDGENAKWFLSVSWQMEGVDIHLGVSVGTQLSALGHTLTQLTGAEDNQCHTPTTQDEVIFRRKYTENLPAFVFDASLDAKQRSKLIEKEMTEQAKIISDLRTLGASHGTIEHEMRRLHDLEALAFKDFRRDMIQKLRRQSVRASSITKNKLGLGPGRSLSVAEHAPELAESTLVLGDSGENLLLDEDNRLADIIEGTSWSSMESEPAVNGPSRSGSLRYGARSVSFQPRVQRQTSLPDPRDRHSMPSMEGEAGVSRHSTGDRPHKPAKTKQPEPSIDLELDVKVHINSGKCVLHTKDYPGDDNMKNIRGMRVGGAGLGGVGRSTSGGLEGSPPARRHKRPPAPDHTTFRVPGLDLKVHYDSKTVPATSSPASGRKTTKKASLFSWITVQSIPEETIISPHILEFLEQTLEPIPHNTHAGTPQDTLSVGASSDGETYGQYVYASFPVAVVVQFHSQPSAFRFSCAPASRVECLLQLPALTIVFSSSEPNTDLASPAGQVAMGGLSVTGCLADFSVFLFHPYGGLKPHKEAQWSPLSDCERKDSLSINVEFVKFHLSRSRKDVIEDSEHAKATIRFSTIVDVGSASFKYDMRRLSEILSFPRAWYRRRIVRRMFLGDTTDPASSSTAVPASPMLPQREKTKTLEMPKAKEPSGGGGGGGAEGAAWETLVLFAVNFTRLHVHMNMGNVMGNVNWQSRDFTSTGRLGIGSTGRRNMLGTLSLRGSALDARGGIVGGAVSVAHVHTHVHISSGLGGEAASRVVGGGAGAASLRLEYMGGAALVARAHKPIATLRHRTDRPTLILAHGKLSWNQLQILMSRSSTPDLMKMQTKLEEFFTQQFKSGKRVFSSLNREYTVHKGRGGAEGSGLAAAEPAPPEPELRHHRHWQKVFDLLRPHLPPGTVLGGTMELQGSNVSLACFHGTSFKAKSWALFSIKEPCISFSTEAQQPDGSDGETIIVQSLTAALGAGVSSGHQSMATVCRMTRTVLFPPQFKSAGEWFQYAFADSEIEVFPAASALYPSLERGAGTAGGAGSTTGGGGAAPPPAPPAPPAAAPARREGRAAHTREVIFALPPLRLHLRTMHHQPHTPPSITDPKPVVECSFITEFEDHIFVSVDAEAFLFLHDLISSYIHEKERLVGGVSTSASAGAGGSGGGAPPAEVASHDYRDYVCSTWHLEPTVRLLSWGGKSLEPYGVDYILQKLGFRHARTTIPKWLQRGALDPLDSILAGLLAAHKPAP